jgi:large subunit ribosomal protein L18
MTGEIRAREARLRRHRRTRKRVVGSADRPRLSVFRSLRHIYAQVIDDGSGGTLVAASTLDANLRDKVDGMSKGEQARMVGELVARRALEKGIREVVFDRGGYAYQGRVRSVAEAARSEGLVF